MNYWIVHSPTTREKKIDVQTKTENLQKSTFQITRLDKGIQVLRLNQFYILHLHIDSATSQLNHNL